LKDVEAVRAEGSIVTDAVVLLDREENGEANLAKNGIKLHYLLTATEVAYKLYDMDAITKDQLNAILKQVKKEVEHLHELLVSTFGLVPTRQM